MDETQTWRAVLADGSVREVFVRFIEMTMSPGVMRWVVSSPSGRGAGFGDTRDEAISGWVRMNSDVREILAPGEPTRAEFAAQIAAVTAERDTAEHKRATVLASLAHALKQVDALTEEARILHDRTFTAEAQLAVATASVQQLRADVELATSQRDAEIAETVRARQREAVAKADTAVKNAAQEVADAEALLSEAKGRLAAAVRAQEDATNALRDVIAQTGGQA